MGVVTGDDAAQDAGSVARCICAAAGGGAESDAVQAALAAAAAGEGGERTEGATTSAGEAVSRLAQAGGACVSALRMALDALAAVGAAEVMRGARALRTGLGVPASAAAKGTLAAHALQTRVDEGAALMALPPQLAERRLTRSSPTGGGDVALPGAGGPSKTSPRAALIRRLRAQLQEAEQSASATPSTSRVLTFEDAASAGDPAAAQRRRAGDAAAGG
eukprot:496110-Pleurochrysis_carterae.AAC.1